MTTMADVETVLDEAGVRMRGAHPAAGHQIGNDRNRNGAGPQGSEAGDRDYLLVEADRRTARSRSGPLRTATCSRWASDPEVAALV